MIKKECFKWSLVRYLHSTGNHPARVRNIEKLFGNELDSEGKVFS